MAASIPSIESGTTAPASFRALFFAAADSASLEPERAPAWPNCTSDLKSGAQVPDAQATTGFVIFLALRASTRVYSSTPPSSF